MLYSRWGNANNWGGIIFVLQSYKKKGIVNFTEHFMYLLMTIWQMYQQQRICSWMNTESESGMMGCAVVLTGSWRHKSCIDAEHFRKCDIQWREKTRILLQCLFTTRAIWTESSFLILKFSLVSCKTLAGIVGQSVQLLLIGYCIRKGIPNDNIFVPVLYDFNKQSWTISRLEKS